MRFEARQEEEATGLPQTVGVSVPKILYGYQSDRLYEVADSCRVWAREDEEAINFKATLAEGPEWKDVVWRGTRKKSNNQLISSRAIDPKGEGSEWNMPLPSKQTIVTELWYNPRKLDERSPSTRSKGSPEVSEQDPQAKGSNLSLGKVRRGLLSQEVRVSLLGRAELFQLRRPKE